MRLSRSRKSTRTRMGRLVTKSPSTRFPRATRPPTTDEGRGRIASLVVAMAQLDPDTFDQLMRELDPAMLIVTAASGNEVGGCLVGFATQASISPPLFALMLSERNRTYRIARAARCLAVHVLDSEQRALAELFGGETGDETDKLEQVDWSPGPEGVP